MFEIFAVREVLLSSCISVLLTGALGIRREVFFFFLEGAGWGGVGGLVISLVPSCKYIVGRKKKLHF